MVPWQVYYNMTRKLVLRGVDSSRRARRVPYFEAAAVDDQGVFEALNTVSRMVLVKGFAQQQEGAPR